MPKITINLDEETNKKLKIIAIQDDRSLGKCIPRFLAEAVKHQDIIDIYLNNTTTTNNITLAQLKELGLKDLSLETNHISTEEKKSKYIEKKKLSLDLTIPNPPYNYIDYDDHMNIKSLLDPDVSYEFIDIYLQELKQEEQLQEDEYLYQTEINTLESRLPHPLSPYYQKIKDYFLKMGYYEDLYKLLQYPCRGAWSENVEMAIMYALGGDYEYMKSHPEQWDEIENYFKAGT